MRNESENQRARLIGSGLTLLHRIALLTLGLLYLNAGLLHPNLSRQYWAEVLPLTPHAASTVTGMIALLGSALLASAALPKAAALSYVSETAILPLLVFHFVRFATGDHLSCDCYTDILALSPLAYVGLELTVATASAWSPLRSRVAGVSKSRAAVRVWLATGYLGALAFALGFSGKGAPEPSAPTTLLWIKAPALIQSSRAVLHPQLSGGGKRATIVVAGDLECPFCTRIWGVLKADCPADVEVRWADLPLRIHAKAWSMAVVAKASGQSDLSVDSLLSSEALRKRLEESVGARLANLPANDRKESESSVRRGANLLTLAGISSTPTLMAIVNDRVYSCRDLPAALETLKEKGQ